MKQLKFAPTLGITSKNFQCETHLLFAKDDPFVCIEKFKEVSISKHISPWFAEHGSHNGLSLHQKAEGIMRRLKLLTTQFSHNDLSVKVPRFGFRVLCIQLED